MTVAELISELEQYDPDEEVIVSAFDIDTSVTDADIDYLVQQIGGTVVIEASVQ